MRAPVPVIGVGNLYRRDDGVGVVVAQRLRELALPGVEPAEESGEPIALITRWTGHPKAIMVDALSSGAAPGTVTRIECRDGNWQAAPGLQAASTHGLGVAEAVELGEVLGRLPRLLVIFGVQPGDVGPGPGLTPAVERAVEDVLARISREVSPVPAADRGAGST